MDRDRRGRRRPPGQGRGLRPLHPLLPPQWVSRALRVAMSAEDWARFDAMAMEAMARVPTQARAHGEAISRLLRDQGGSPGRPDHWMDWERQKTLRLLRRAN